jgi:hypothetical protein
MLGIDGNFSAPFIYDVNGDLVPDLLVGEEDGVINYYENQGTASAMLFGALPTNSYFGEIDVRKFPDFDGYAAQIISPLDTSEKLYLVAGCYEGSIRVYEFDTTSIYGGEFRRVFNHYSGIDEGERSAPTIADITGDGKFELVTGNYRGGLAYFSQSDSVAFPDAVISRHKSDHGINVYPNPAHQQVSITLNGFKRSQPVIITLTDILGRDLAQLTTTVEQNIMSLPQVSPGMYFMIAWQGSAVAVKKMLISRK